MYAVVDLGGKQYKVEKGDEVIVDRLDVGEGKSLTMKPVLLGGGKKAVTAAELKGARVKAKVEEHLLGEKVRVFKYKPKRGYRNMRGHRSRLSRVTIQSITSGKKKAEQAEKPATAAKAEAAKKPAPTEKTATAKKSAPAEKAANPE